MAVTEQFKQDVLEVLDEYTAALENQSGANRVPVMAEDEIDETVSMPAVKYNVSPLENRNAVPVDFRQVPVATFFNRIDSLADEVSEATSELNTLKTDTDNARRAAAEAAADAGDAIQEAYDKATYAQNQGTYAQNKGDYAKDVGDHPTYIADGTPSKPGTVGYVYQWDYTHQVYVRGARIALDWDTMSDAEKEAISAEVLAQLTFASEQTCEDIIEELF